MIKAKNHYHERPGCENWTYISNHSAEPEHDFRNEKNLRDALKSGYVHVDMSGGILYLWKEDDGLYYSDSYGTENKGMGYDDALEYLAGMCESFDSDYC